jgi:hypothetical protein
LEVQCPLPHPYRRHDAGVFMYAGVDVGGLMSYGPNLVDA